jgi:hypothetical protein
MTPLPAQLDVALKEWAVVCDALGSGRQIMLLRKGGIEESIGGFELEHSAFLLFPTYVHQKAQMLKPDAARGIVAAETEPEKITLSLAAAVDGIFKIANRQQVDLLEDQHIWTRPLIDMRFDYRPRNPLYLLVLRVYRLAQTRAIDNLAAYAGCKSWVPLNAPVCCEGAQPVLSEQQFAERCGIVGAAISAGGLT